MTYQGNQQKRKHSTGLNPDDEIRIILIGKTGNGKSASGNTLLQREAFESRRAPRSVTSECEKAEGKVNGRRIAVIDTLGIYDSKLKEDEVVKKLKKCISLSVPGPHAFLIVIKLDRFTEEEQKTVELLQKVFGAKAADYSMVLFTNVDQLEDTTIEEFTSQCPKLTGLIKRCKDRYHVFNNKDKDISQVSQLVEKIDKMVCENGGGHYTNEMFQEAQRIIQEEKEKRLKAEAERAIQKEKEKRLRAEAERAFQEEKEKRLKAEAERAIQEEKLKRLKAQVEAERAIQEVKERLKAERAIQEEKEKRLKAQAEAERAIQEEKEKRLKAQAEAERAIQEENEEKLKAEAEEKCRQEMEKGQKKTFLTSLAVGASVGAVGGPVGVALGTVGGAVVGLLASQI